MMSETYVECLVKKKTSLLKRFLRALSIMLAGAFIFLGFILWPALFIGVVLGVAAYFIYMNCDLEYEYLYLDKEITIDKVMATTRRKRVAKYEVDRMEIFAPMNSHQLDSYRNRDAKTKDYSSGEVKQPEARYAMYYEGGEKIILEPSADMVKALKTVAPRKVFTE